MEKLESLITKALRAKTITITELRKNFRKFTKRAAEGECFAVTKYGKPTLCLMSPDFYRILASPSNDKPP